MCGIFGWQGKKTQSFDKTKFNILGIANDSRGGHSCGIYSGGRINIGVDDLKLYNKYICKHPKIKLNKIPVVIGHTRYATGGEHNVANAHPFGFGTININGQNYNEFTGVHNGTIVGNGVDIAKQFEIDVYDNKRKKIDSEILLEAIYKKGFKSVLEFYNGAAALIWNNLNEPNVTYYYHGKSYKYDDFKYNKHAFPIEERPLYGLKQNKNSLYVSSIKESLMYLTDDFSKIFEFEFNCVYKVTDGDIDNAEKTYIDRSNKYQKIFYSNYSGYPSTTYLPDKKEDKSKKSDVINIHTESIQKFKNNPISFHKFRFKRNGHCINGVYLWIDNYGFFLLGFNAKSALHCYNFLVGQSFNYADKVFEKNKHNVVINHKTTNLTSVPNVFYFKFGICLKSYTDFIAIEMSSKKYYSVNDLSHMSRHPITFDVSTIYKPNDQFIIKDGTKYTGKFNMIGSNIVYNVKNGNLIGYEAFENDIDLINNDDDEDNIDEELVEIFDDVFTELSISIDRLDLIKESSEEAKSFHETLTQIKEHLIVKNF